MPFQAAYRIPTVRSAAALQNINEEIFDDGPWCLRVVPIILYIRDSWVAVGVPQPRIIGTGVCFQT